MDRLEWQLNKCMKLEECNKGLVKALGSFKAALWDSLYGKGITKKYAQSVSDEIDAAVKKYSDEETIF